MKADGQKLTSAFTKAKMATKAKKASAAEIQSKKKVPPLLL